MKRAVIGEQGFRDLVAGKVAQVLTYPGEEPIEIVLSDIGWVSMGIAIHDAQRKDNPNWPFGASRDADEDNRGD